MARILIVEDEPSLADALRRGLVDERHTVDVFDDGPSGLEAIQTDAYDLVILDWMLPGLDGVEICRRCRRGRHLVPILMLTAKDTTDDVVRGLDAGANDFLTKPFAFDELLARTRALLRAGSGQTAQIEVDGLTLDTTDRRVFRDGREIPLTTKEYQLLERLVSRPGQILSKDRLREVLWSWDDEPDTSDNTIEVYVSSLRRKLDTGDGRCRIRTMRGRGYVFEADAPCSD